MFNHLCIKAQIFSYLLQNLVFFLSITIFLQTNDSSAVSQNSTIICLAVALFNEKKSYALIPDLAKAHAFVTRVLHTLHARNSRWRGLTLGKRRIGAVASSCASVNHPTEGHNFPVQTRWLTPWCNPNATHSVEISSMKLAANTS